MKRYFKVICFILALMILLVSCNNINNYEEKKVLWHEKDTIVNGKTILTIDDFSEYFEYHLEMEYDEEWLHKMGIYEKYERYVCELGIIYILPSSELAHKAYFAYLAEMGAMYIVLYRINNVIFWFPKKSIYGEKEFPEQTDESFKRAIAARDKIFEFLDVNEAEWTSIVYPYKVYNNRRIDGEKLLDYFKNNDSFHIEQVKWGDFALDNGHPYRYSKEGYIITNNEMELFVVIRLHETQKELRKLQEIDREKYLNLMSVQDQYVYFKFYEPDLITGFNIYNEPYTIWIPTKEWLDVVNSI